MYQKGISPNIWRIFEEVNRNKLGYNRRSLGPTPNFLINIFLKCLASIIPNEAAILEKD